jgi:hypothetical protein
LLLLLLVFSWSGIGNGGLAVGAAGGSGSAVTVVGVRGTNATYLTGVFGNLDWQPGDRPINYQFAEYFIPGIVHSISIFNSYQDLKVTVEELE